MPNYTPEQRKACADQICDLVRTWVEDLNSSFEIDLERGVQWCTDAATGDRVPRANPTITFTLKINGGAEDSQGPPIVRTPTMFRPPES